MNDRAAAFPLGLVRGLPNEDYHAIKEAIGSSGLRKLARSPLHFFGSTLDPQRPAPATSSSMANGTLTHCALLEPDQLDQRYIVVPGDAPRKPSSTQRNAKNPSAETLHAIEWWAEFEAEHGAKIVIEPELLQTAQRQAASIRALPEIGPLLLRGEAEVSAFWIDPQTGVLCKVRPDWVTPGGAGVVLLDLKTTQDASPHGFRRAIGNYRYDLQAAFYSDGYEKATGQMVLGFVFAVVESEWPHAAATYMLDDASMDKARSEVRALLNLYAECKREDTWPGYVPFIQPISTPGWVS